MNLTQKIAQSSYIDLVLRKPRLSGSQARSLLVEALDSLKIMSETNHLSIPLKNASLQLWLEQKLRQIVFIRGKRFMATC
jgi:hypothetical protein